MHFKNGWKAGIGVLAVLALALGVFFALRSEKAVLMHPKGIIAESELHLIATQYFLMFLIIIPTFILLFVVAWKYRANNLIKRTEGKAPKEVVLWLIPSVVIGVMAVITWRATHRLDPYKPLESAVKPVVIQVVALDWKWLFLYPEQGIASVNYVQFPEKTPIAFALSADGSPMNSFWIPQLSGQIYSMIGMTTALHLMADGPGKYVGRAAEINGKGYADMTFVAESCSDAEFETWVKSAKESPFKLTDAVYAELLKPSVNNPIVIYSDVEKDLFHTIVMKYMHPD
jgi:cytochrome o ubiquinol oxidase subunit 2